MKRWLGLLMSLVMVWSLWQLPVSTAQAGYDRLPAFPGAEGFGYAAAGGRGGEVYHVTSYELTGPGTFHDALLTAGATPRTIVFDISGEITIPQIVVKNKANLTIAGQTAAGDGVTIRGNNIRFINCSDIVVRYLRFRMGHQSFQDDTMYFEDCRNVMIDHSSFSWGSDEVLSIKSKDYDHPKSKNISVQWSIISEGLLTHSMGGLIEMNTITMHHNLYAHNNDRNPKTKGQIDFVNNIIYNWGSFPYVAGGESGTKSFGNVVGNTFIAGINSANPDYAVVRGNENYQVYLADNRIDSNRNGVLDGTDTGTGMIEPERPSVVVTERFEYPPVHTQKPEEAYELVLKHSGASLNRDAVDKRVIDSVMKQTGAIIGNEQDAGGFPVLRKGTAPADTDRDGMPDVWERAHRLNPGDPEDRNGDRDGDGYTNLEEYLNELAAPGFPGNYPTSPPAWTGTPFEPPAIPVEEPEPVPVPTLDGKTVRNVVITDNSSNGAANAANWSIQQNLQAGDLVAGDRMTGSKVYRFASIPDTLKGMEWLRSPVASRSATNPDVVSFYLAADTDVYVAHDARISSKPEWLSSAYEDTGLTIADDQPITFNLFKKHYPAGAHVVMGANNGSSSMNYFVILKPTDPGTAPPAAPPAGLEGKRTEGPAVSLGWQPVSGVGAYLIYRSTPTDPYFKAVGSSAKPEFTDDGAAFGGVYRYRVSALNAGGESPLSGGVEVPVYDASQPAPASPAGLKITEAKSLSVKMAWTPVEGAVSYGIFRSGAPDGAYEPIGTTTAAHYTDKSVDPATTYYYRVAARSAGGESARSDSVKAVTLPAVPVPQAPEGLTAGEVTTTSFAMEWKPAEYAETYSIYRKAQGDNDFSFLASTPDPRFIDDSVSAGNSGYSYRVTAVNEKGESPPSPILELSMPLPAAPTDLRSGLKGETFVGLIWTVDDPSPQYNIYRESAGRPAEYVGYAKVETFYDRTVEPGVEYTYWVKAKNATGESPPSASLKVTTPLVRDLDHLDEALEAAYAEGLIFDKGVLNSLLAKVNQAQQGKENSSNVLRALEQELSALAGSQADASFVRKIREDLLYLVEQAEL